MISRERLEAPVQYLKGVGPRRAADLASLGIHTVGDLLGYLPRRYDDRRALEPVARLREGEVCTVRVLVRSVAESRPRQGLYLLRATVADGSGELRCTWFNQPHLKRVVVPGAVLLVNGRVERAYGKIQMAAPEVEAVEGDDPIHMGRIVPVYPASARVRQRWLRGLMHVALAEFADDWPEILAEDLQREQGLMPARKAIVAAHFPTDEVELERARRRLAFDDFVVLQVALSLVRDRARRVPGLAHPSGGRLVEEFLARLPFRLTPAQERAWLEICADLEAPVPMNRLLQGDVGSGKTVVAALALLKSVSAGCQAALMVPTEILAEQHFRRLGSLWEGLGVRLALLVGSQPREERETVRQGLAQGSVDVVVGTHALLQEAVSFRRLSVVVIDEQHRFGVRQRAELPSKGDRPDVLVMTATPIPRTLALTAYGDLDLSVIDALPPGRRPTRTVWARSTERGKVYAFLRDRVAEGLQGYVVCPLVEESEAVEARAVTEWLERLRGLLPQVRFAGLHGRMRPEERDEVMAAFIAGSVDVLVATTVIEVGVDVPNAAVMIIEGAERFGLAQLHQLRGRVGRGGAASYCFLVGDPATDEARRRLEAIARTTDGFALAEADLELRGPGDVLGTRQHGVVDVVVAHLAHAGALLGPARELARGIVVRDPQLQSPEHLPLRRLVAARYGSRMDLAGIG